MNINSIQNSSTAYGMHEPRRSQPLTDDQKVPGQGYPQPI